MKMINFPFCIHDIVYFESVFEAAKENETERTTIYKFHHEIEAGGNLNVERVEPFLLIQGKQLTRFCSKLGGAQFP